jgi:uncharacterized protein YjbJ (UPF0337 family)
MKFVASCPGIFLAHFLLEEHYRHVGGNDQGGITIMGANEERVKGAAEELKGKIKKGFGDLTDNEQMEAEGEAERLKGQARQDAAKAAEYSKGVGEELKGNFKKGVGDLVDDEQMEAEGEAERLKGQARQKANQ